MAAMSDAGWVESVAELAGALYRLGGHYPSLHIGQVSRERVDALHDYTEGRGQYARCSGDGGVIVVGWRGVIAGVAVVAQYSYTDQWQTEKTS